MKEKMATYNQLSKYCNTTILSTTTKWYQVKRKLEREVKEDVKRISQNRNVI